MTNFCTHLISTVVLYQDLANVVKQVFLTDFFVNIINDIGKKYIFSPSLLQGLYQKLFKSFGNYIPINIISNTFNEDDFYLVSDEIVIDKTLQKSKTEMDTYESIDEIKYPQKYEDGGIIILNHLNEKKKQYVHTSNDRTI